jgi:hypothetical protein
MKFKEKILKISTLIIIMSGFLFGCVGDGEILPNDLVIVNAKELNADVPIKGPEQRAALASVEALKERFPDPVDKAIDKIFPEAKVLVVAEKKDVNPAVFDKNVPEVIFLTPSTVIDPDTGEISSDPSGVIGSITTAVGAAVPGAAPFIPLVFLAANWALRKRSRQHWTSFFKALIPYDGNISGAEAFSSLQKAIGAEHSVDSPEELRRLADKIEATNKISAINESKKVA